MKAVASCTSVSTKRVRFTRKQRDCLAGYLFLTPFLIGLFAFTLIPFVYSLYLSFTEYNILSPAKWIGVDNFIRMFTRDAKFLTAFKVTVKFALLEIPLKLAVSLLVAVVLSKHTKLTNFYRAAFYVPSLLGGGVAVAMTWKQLWRPNGVINELLSVLGIEPVAWLLNKDTALYVLVIYGVWQFGSQMLIFLAAINDVPASLHEAAIVDGAGPIKRFFTITLPMLTPSLFFNLINGIIGSLQAFNSAYLVTSGGPMNSTLFYGLYQYQQAFQFGNMGYASAMAWFMMLVIVMLTALVFKSSSAWVFYQDDRA